MDDEYDDTEEHPNTGYFRPLIHGELIQRKSYTHTCQKDKSGEEKVNTSTALFLLFLSRENAWPEGG